MIQMIHNGTLYTFICIIKDVKDIAVSRHENSDIFFIVYVAGILKSLLKRNNKKHEYLIYFLLIQNFSNFARSEENRVWILWKLHSAQYGSVFRKPSSGKVIGYLDIILTGSDVFGFLFGLDRFIPLKLLVFFSWEKGSERRAII